MSNLLALTKLQDMELFRELFQSVGIKNADELVTAAINVLETESDEIINNLESRWYSSLNGGSPDYSVYDEIHYLVEVIYCYETYSKKYLKRYQQGYSLKPFGIYAETKNASVVVDLGNGLGITTAILKQLYPAALVYGTNVENSIQYKISEILASKHNFTMVPDVKAVGTKTDLIFASEYFEHFQDPVPHLVEVIKYLNPDKLLIANAFGANAIGHFDSYIFKNQQVTPATINRLFNKTLVNLGYRKVKTTLWNDRPNYWKRSQ